MEKAAQVVDTFIEFLVRICKHGEHLRTRRYSSQLRRRVAARHSIRPKPCPRLRQIIRGSHVQTHQGEERLRDPPDMRDIVPDIV
ncbi:unnamed protein product [Brassica oleracea]